MWLNGWTLLWLLTKINTDPREERLIYGLSQTLEQRLCVLFSLNSKDFPALRKSARTREGTEQIGLGWKKICLKNLEKMTKMFTKNLREKNFFTFPWTYYKKLNLSATWEIKRSFRENVWMTWDVGTFASKVYRKTGANAAQTNLLFLPKYKNKITVANLSEKKKELVDFRGISAKIIFWSIFAKTKFSESLSKLWIKMLRNFDDCHFPIFLSLFDNFTFASNLWFNYDGIQCL